MIYFIIGILQYHVTPPLNMSSDSDDALPASSLTPTIIPSIDTLPVSPTTPLSSFCVWSFDF